MGPPKPKPRAKTFTGCWTCRARKVKCDLARPHCSRCDKARVECRGYGLPLYWVMQDELSVPAFKRQARSLPLGNPHWPPASVHGDVVDDCLRDIEQLVERMPRPDGFWSGPFGVFRLDGEVTAATVPPSGIAEEVLPLPAGLELMLASRRSDTPSTVTAGNAGSIDDYDEDLDGAVPRQPSTDILPLVAWPFEADARTDTLPVLHARNAYSTIYANEALAVARRMSLRPDPASGPVQDHGWDSKVALMYSLLASSSVHMSGGRRSSDGTHAISRSFRVHAVSHLRKALGSLSVASRGEGYDGRRRGQDGTAITTAPPHVPAQLEAVLKVMLTLVTADIMDGHMDEFWIHLDATRALVRCLQHRVPPGSSGEHLVNIARFLRIISDSTDVTLAPVAWTTPSREAGFVGGGRSLEYTYGITARLALLLSRAGRLARSAAYYYATPTGRAAELPLAFTQACDALLADLTAWHISQETLPSFSESDDVTGLLAAKHIHAFAGSIQIYLYARVVSPAVAAATSPSAAWPSSASRLLLGSRMTALGHAVVGHLADIEAIKARTGYAADTPTATITWPGFIASCQAGRDPALRAAWTKWWRQMVGYGIGNIHDLWSVVQQAWALDESEPSELDVPWAAVLRRTGRRILAI
ncbi:hypothetical protein GMORB2_4773 [Geosmithia morbida]|uniref:Zn(2)-C6 fungal-type domain-containing protein n=1 Tax=Geosmithia morbida TaxID=1094350 RepID=A0A9P5D0G6_9HYPO|nr:uncharacterized protein GMORB2_4773 [Geosmithia morbida]KAF4119431.1 hypothetical protein GMORB2_4773 [Geosmithia morbida]